LDILLVAAVTPELKRVPKVLPTSESSPKILLERKSVATPPKEPKVDAST